MWPDRLTTPIPPNFAENNRRIEKLKLPITPAELADECEGDTDCERAFTSMMEYAIRYASDVWDMEQLRRSQSSMSKEEWAEQFAKADADRTQLHDTYIDSIAILSRALGRAERDNTWVRDLAPTGKLERAACGRFAIMLTYWLAVNSRSDIDYD